MGTKVVPATPRQASVTPEGGIALNTIKYSMSKRLAIGEDVAAGFPMREVAVRHNVSVHAVHSIAHDPVIQEMISPEIVERRRRTMGTIYMYQADSALSGIKPEDWEKINPLQRMTASAIAFDKARLANGESTSNVSVVGVVDNLISDSEELRKKKEMLLSSSVSVSPTRNESANEEKRGRNNSNNGWENEKAL